MTEEQRQAGTLRREVAEIEVTDDLIIIQRATQKNPIDTDTIELLTTIGDAIGNARSPFDGGESVDGEAAFFAMKDMISNAITCVLRQYSKIRP
jgi:hypothetical protein